MVLTDFELALHALPVPLAVISLHILVVLEYLHELLADERGLGGQMVDNVVCVGLGR